MLNVKTNFTILVNNVIRLSLNQVNKGLNDQQICVQTVLVTPGVNSSYWQYKQCVSLLKNRCHNILDNDARNVYLFSGERAFQNLGVLFI